MKAVVSGREGDELRCCVVVVLVVVVQHSSRALVLSVLLISVSVCPLVCPAAPLRGFTATAKTHNLAITAQSQSVFVHSDINLFPYEAG